MQKKSLKDEILLNSTKIDKKRDKRKKENGSRAEAEYKFIHKK